MERLFGVMIQCGSWMSEQVMLKFITGETSLYDKTDEEKAAYEKKRDGIGLLYKMMIYAKLWPFFEWKSSTEDLTS